MPSLDDRRTLIIVRLRMAGWDPDNLKGLAIMDEAATNAWEAYLRDNDYLKALEGADT